MKKLITFLRRSREELKKVQWPNKEQAIAYTRNVVIVSLGVAILLGTLDFIFNWVITKII